MISMADLRRARSAFPPAGKQPRELFQLKKPTLRNARISNTRSSTSNSYPTPPAHARIHTDRDSDVKGRLIFQINNDFRPTGGMSNLINAYMFPSGVLV